MTTFYDQSFKFVIIIFYFILLFYRSPPSCIERREILRDYVAMWKKDISDSSIQNFVSPKIKFFTADTPSTQIEAQNNEDLILVKYVATFNNIKCEEEIFENNKNDSHLFDQGTCSLVSSYRSKQKFELLFDRLL